MRASDNARKFTENLWLEDHIGEYEALYTTDWGSAARKAMAPNLIKNNPDQDTP
jgi:hypothetical protein